MSKNQAIEESERINNEPIHLNTEDRIQFVKIKEDRLTVSYCGHSRNMTDIGISFLLLLFLLYQSFSIFP